MANGQAVMAGARSPVQANYAGTGPAAKANYSQQQNMIMEAFRAEEYIKDQMDVQAEPFWDTVQVATGGVITQNTTTAIFFRNIQNKPLNLTNMTESSQLPNPEALAIFAYRYQIDPRDSLLDVENVMAGFAFVFYMGRKAYQTIPLWQIPQGGGIDIQGCCTGCVLHNGRPTKEAIRPIAITFILEQGVNFWSDMAGNPYTVTSAFGYTSQVNLDGLHARGIQ
jgi:hypothetical protein